MLLQVQFMEAIKKYHFQLQMMFLTQYLYMLQLKEQMSLMAESYSNLFSLKIIGLRFFTVYGPWGRPDMAIWQFTDAILKNKPINVFHKGI